MKLIIQIPCHNEEKTLPQVVDDLPKHIPGIQEIEYLVVDDGSIDQTAEVARQCGVHHVIPLSTNRGYGTAFLTGIRKCIELGADVIVNTDGDNQYQGQCVQDLIRPILQENADIVIGTRPIQEIEHFSWIKKKLQRLGSYVAGKFAGTPISDATSGFRAYSAAAAMRLHIISHYSHSLETIIQAGHMKLLVRTVPIAVNPKTRESRLMTSMGQYVLNSIFIILRCYVRHQPLRTFIYLSIPPGLVGFLLGVRFVIYFIAVEKPTGMIQSLILAAILLIISFLLIVLGILADLIGTNRNLIQEVSYLVQNKTFNQK